MRPGNIELHIEELVLHGFDPGDGRRIGSALEAELTRLLTEQGLPPSLARGAEIEHLRGERFEVTPDTAPEEIGGHVARAVYGGLRT